MRSTTACARPELDTLTTWCKADRRMHQAMARDPSPGQWRQTRQPSTCRCKSVVLWASNSVTCTAHNAETCSAQCVNNARSASFVPARQPALMTTTEAVLTGRQPRRPPTAWAKLSGTCTLRARRSPDAPCSHAPTGARRAGKTVRAHGCRDARGGAPGCGCGPAWPDDGYHAEATTAAASSRRCCAYRDTPAGVQRTPSLATYATRWGPTLTARAAMSLCTAARSVRCSSKSVKISASRWVARTGLVSARVRAVSTHAGPPEPYTRRSERTAILAAARESGESKSVSADDPTPWRPTMGATGP